MELLPPRLSHRNRSIICLLVLGLFAWTQSKAGFALSFKSPFPYVSTSPEGRWYLKVDGKNGPWSANMYYLDGHGNETLKWKIPNWYEFPWKVTVSDYGTLAVVKDWLPCKKDEKVRCKAGENDLAVSLWGPQVKDGKLLEEGSLIKSFTVLELLKDPTKIGYSDVIDSYQWYDFKINYDNLILIKTNEGTQINISMYDGRFFPNLDYYGFGQQSIPRISK